MYQIVGCSCTRADEQECNLEGPTAGTELRPPACALQAVGGGARQPGPGGGAARRRCSAYTFPAVTPAGLREHGRGREGSTRDELPPAEGRGHQTGGGRQGSSRAVASRQAAGCGGRIQSLRADSWWRRRQQPSRETREQVLGFW